MKKAYIFRENYLEVMKRYSGFDNYDILMEKLNSFKNPLDFFDFVSATDFTVDLHYQSDQFFTQEQFNSFLLDLGINPKIDSI